VGREALLEGQQQGLSVEEVLRCRCGQVGLLQDHIWVEWVNDEAEALDVNIVGNNLLNSIYLKVDNQLKESQGKVINLEVSFEGTKVRGDSLIGRDIECEVFIIEDLIEVFDLTLKGSFLLLELLSSSDKRPDIKDILQELLFWSKFLNCWPSIDHTSGFRHSGRH
jgi:hypothetical protein